MTMSWRRSKKEQPKEELFVSDFPCEVCGTNASLKLACGGCKLERYYCTTYSCQFDDWSKHQQQCQQLMETIYKEDTVVTRLSDGSTSERKRRRSVDLDFQERVPVLDINAKQIIRPDMEGWLANPGDSLQNWQLRYFVLKEDILLCFNNENSLALGGIVIAGFMVRSADEELKEKHSLKIYHTDGPVHYFVAQSKEDCNNWIKALTRAIVLQPDFPAKSISLRKGSTDSTLSRRQDYALKKEDSVRQILLRSLEPNAKLSNMNTVSRATAGMLFGGSDRLVRIRPTSTLSDVPTSEESHDTLSRSAAMARILAQPASYPRSSIRQMALDLGSDKVAKFATQRRSSISSFFKRANTASKAGAISSLPDLSKVSPKTRGSLDEFTRNFTSLNLDTSTPTRNGDTSTRNGDTDDSPISPSSFARTRSTRSSIDGNPLQNIRRARAESIVGPNVDGWGGASGGQGRRRSVVLGVDGAPPLMPAVAYKPAAMLRANSFDSEGSSSQAAESSQADDRMPAFREGFLERIHPNGEKTKLWCVLDDFYMRAFDNEDSVQCILEVDLEGCQIEEEGTTGFKITHGSHSLTVNAPDAAERAQWLSVINEMRDYFIITDDVELDFLNGNMTSSTDLHETSQTQLHHNDSEEFNADIERLVIDIKKQSTSVVMRSGSADLLEGEQSSASLRPSVPTIEALLRVETEDPATRTATLIQAQPSPPPSPILQAPPTPRSIRSNHFNGDSPQSNANKTRKHTVLYPMKGLVEGQLWTPQNAQILSVEEMKTYAINTGAGQEEPSTKSVMYQSGNDVVLQYETGQDGKQDKYTIAAGTSDQLVARLADENHPDSNYIDIFLLTYRHILTPAALMDKLRARFNVIPPEDATPDQLSYYDRWAGVIQVRTIGVVKKWIDNYYVDFDTDQDAYQHLQCFLEDVEQTGPALASLLQRLRSLITQKQEAIKAQKMIEAVREPPKKQKLDFLQIEPREFARQMTLVDHAKFAAVHPVEFVLRLWEGNGPNTQNLSNFVDWFNRMSYFVATLICVQPNVKKRAGIVENFIKIMKECQRLRNFNGMMALLSGLSNASVRRLKKTWALVTPKSMETLQQIETTMSSAFNYRNYRELINEIDRQSKPGAVIPFMGLFLRDLTFLNDGNPKKFKGGLYNYGKLRMVAQRILRLQVYQAASYSSPPSRHAAQVKEFLENPNAMTDENALYKCSLLCEPREDGTGPVRLIEKWAKETPSSSSSTMKSHTSSRSKDMGKTSLVGIAADPTALVTKKSK